MAGGKPDVTAPERGKPVKCFYRRRYCDDQRCDHKHTAQEWVHARYKHMVAPHDEGQYRDADQRINHRMVTEDRFTRVDGKYFRGNTHCRHDDDINFRVTQEPE